MEMEDTPAKPLVLNTYDVDEDESLKSDLHSEIDSSEENEEVPPETSESTVERIIDIAMPHMVTIPVDDSDNSTEGDVKRTSREIDYDNDNEEIEFTQAQNIKINVTSLDPDTVEKTVDFTKPHRDSETQIAQFLITGRKAIVELNEHNYDKFIGKEYVVVV